MTVGYPDWQRGVQLADNPVILLNQVDVLDSNDFDLGDVRRFSSYIFRAIYGSTGPASPTNYGAVLVRFFGGPGLANLIWEDFFELNTGNATALIVDAMHGGDMEVSTVLPAVAGQSINLLVMGSNRPIPRLHVHERSGNDRIPIIATTRNIAAGGSSDVFAPLQYGPCDIEVSTTGQPGAFSLFLGTLTPAHSIISLLANARTFREIVLPLRPLRIHIVNTGAAAANFTVSMWGRDN